MDAENKDTFETIGKKNYVFNQLVKDENDFVGYVAYTLYKQNKVAHITQIKKEKGTAPSDEELRNWQKSECTETRLNHYRQLAEQKTNSFVNQLRNKKEEELRNRKSEIDNKEQENKKKAKELKEREKNIANREKYCRVKVKGSFWSGVLQSVIASFIFLVLCLLMLLCIKGNADIITWFKDLL